MDAVKESLLGAVRYLGTAGIPDVIDMLIVAFLIYKLSMFIRKTNSSRVANGILVLLVIMWLSGYMGLNVINFILRRTVELGLLALVILFQPELRRMLEKMGTGKFSYLLGGEAEENLLETAITQTVLACADMSKTKTGALVVFERANRLSDPLTTGTMVNADTTAELLKNIFYNKAPLHDGAVIIREGRILAAGCMLPMSGNTNLSKDLGMRHRAGIGVSENSDAVVVICSEETGAISVAVDGMLKRHLNPETAETLLRHELLAEQDNEKAAVWFTKLTQFKVKRNAKK
ncbi:MAG: diadenylate cyclase CdaA [Oscillospiraceae bacterium]